MESWWWLPLVVMVVGLLLFLFAPGKWSEVGKIMLFTGMLVTLFVLAHARFVFGIR